MKNISNDFSSKHRARYEGHQENTRKAIALMLQRTYEVCSFETAGKVRIFKGKKKHIA